MDQQQRDAIHERASSHYLSGEYGAALEAWERLLEADPSDERAVEGIRLCRQMAQGEEDAVWTAGQSPFAASASAPNVGEAGAAAPPQSAAGAGSAPGSSAAPASAEAGFDLGEIDDVLEETMGGLGGPAAAAPDTSGGDDDEGALDLSGLASELGTDAPDVSPGQDPHSTSFGGGFASAPPGDEIDREGDPGDADVATWGWSTGGGEEPDAAPGSRTESPKPTLDPSTVELRRRVNELLANALVFMEQGRKDEASKTLERLLILDEMNEAALSLRAKIEAESTDDRPFDAAAIAGTSGPAAGSAVRPIDDGAMDGDDLPPLDLALGDPATDDPFEEDAADDPCEAAGHQPSNVPTVPGMAGVDPIADRARSGRIWLYGVAGMVLLTIVAIYALQYSSPVAQRPEPIDTAATAAAEVDAALAPVDLPDSLLQQPERVEADPDPEPTRSDLVANALTEGESAMAAGNYDRAVIAYDRALKLRPGNIQIRQRLDRATVKYREAQQIESQWQEAASQWEAGNFKAALRILYRLPDGSDPERLDRLQAYGWYNLGVQALRVGDCASATSHFDEAYSMRTEDTRIRAGTWLAAACPGRGASTYRMQVEALELHPFE